MRGGTTFPASFSNSDAAASPQSYLPYNNFSADPGYSVINSRNTGDFLTGATKGGRRLKYNGGDDTGAAKALNIFSGTAYSSLPAKIMPMA
jgi:hypothetical protein